MPNASFLPAFAAPAMVAALLCASADAHAELGGTMPSQSNSTAAAAQTLLNGALRLRTLTDAGNTTLN